MALDVREVNDPGRTGPAFRGPLSPKQQSAVQYVIGQVDHANMFGGHPATFIPNSDGGWRVDRQNPPEGYVNISVQRNGINPPSTIATVFVPVNLNIDPPLADASENMLHAYSARMRELDRVTRRGLEQSLASHRERGNRTDWEIIRFEVIGDFSA